MSVVTLGNRIAGQLAPLGSSPIGLAVLHKPYELQFETSPVEDPSQLARILYDLKSYYPEVTATYVEVGPTTTRLQIAGSPFSWEVLMPILPDLFLFAGVIMIVVSVFTIIGAIPTWALVTLGAGIFLAVVVPRITRGR